jgi:hypothetical protein
VGARHNDAANIQVPVLRVSPSAKPVFEQFFLLSSHPSEPDSALKLFQHWQLSKGYAGFKFYQVQS